MDHIISLAVALLNTDTVMALAVTALVGFIVSRCATSDGFKKFEPLLITAIKMAEKSVPDDTPNTGAAKADQAMRLFLKEYERVTGNEASKKVVTAAELALPKVHEELEANGTL